MGTERKKGSRGEDEASAWLLESGFRILARNARSPGSEIDIIASKARILHIIEVKRWAYDFSQAEYILSAQKRASLYSGARAWLGKNPQYLDYSIQFDLIYFDTLSMRFDFVEKILE